MMMTERERLVRQLLDRQAESRSLDYKAAMSFGPTKADKGEILKCIMAFANTRDGGYMLIGVEQAGGTFVPRGVSTAQAASFDPTALGEFAKNYCSALPDVTMNVVTVDSVDLVLLRIAEFTDEPILCTKDLHDGTGKAFILRAGNIYVRTPDAQCKAIDSGEVMRALLDLAVQKRGDALLHQIRRLMGAPVTQAAPGYVEAYAEELTSAESLFNKEGITGSYWYFEVAPSDYRPARIDSNVRLREIRQQSAVSVRGWDFPHVDREHDQAFESGIESVTHWSRYHEAHRLYRSGLFTWRRQVGEDFTEQYRGAVSYVSAIYSLTEFFLFASRYAPLVSDEGEFTLRLGVSGLADRVLRLDSDGFREDYRTGASSFARTYQLPIEELRASHLELAAQAARELFELYNLDVSLETIAGWQKRLIEQRS